MDALVAGATNILEELFEPGDELLKCLFANGSRRQPRIKIVLVYTFGEEACKSPVRHRLCDLKHGLLTLLPSEMYIGVGVAVGLESAITAGGIGRPQEA